MVSIADHWKDTSPAASVLSTSVLASDLTMAPVRRSPFFRVIWSAKAQVDISIPTMSTNMGILDTTTSSQVIKGNSFGRKGHDWAAPATYRICLLYRQVS